MMVTRKESIVDDFHGTKVADPYRWLEDPESEETKQWVKAMGEQCDTYFSMTNTRDADQEKLEQLWNYPKLFVPKKVNGKLFYQRNDGMQNQAVLYIKDENNEEKVVIDPNTLSDDGTVAMTNFFISHEGTYIAYALSNHGSDWQEIRVRHVESGEDEPDLLQHVKFTSVAWAPDDSGFYYNRFPKLGTVSEEDEGNFNKVYFHKLGTDQDEDQLIYGDENNKELMFSPMISDDNKYLIIHVYQGTATENQVYVMPLDTQKVSRLLDEQDASYYYVTNDDDFFYFQTDLHAPNSRVISIDLRRPERENWQEVIAERDDVIDDYIFINNKFVIAYLHDAHHQLHVFNKDGTYTDEIKLPMIGSLTTMTRNEEDNDIYLGMTSYLNPTVVYQYKFDEQKLSVVEEANLPVDTSEFETNQVFYTSKDGTKVPMFMTHHKDVKLDGQNPVILYGYGGFNINITPAFNPAVLRWLEKGGIYAVANLRGGTESGEEWHRAGMLENKQNVFDDFIAAGEWLIENKYTSREKLAIMGGSNGGLLVAACMVQRPDLFGAVLCMVPVIDMLRYHKFTIGRYWMSEYGDPENPEHFPFLYAYSPLHNVKEGEKYPPVLIATAESDDRVVPAHAKKFAATLLEKAREDSTVVLRLEAKAGHGLGKPTAKVIEEWVDIFAFLDRELKM